MCLCVANEFYTLEEITLTALYLGFLLCQMLEFRYTKLLYDYK